MEKSFIGNYPGKVDSKERMVLPSSFRREIKDMNDVVFYVRKDIHEDCLVLYPEHVWNKIFSDLAENTKFSDKKKRALIRGVAKDVHELNFSGVNGRMLIPRRILNTVGIKREVVFLGIGNRIELWDAEAYENVDNISEEFSNSMNEFF